VIIGTNGPAVILDARTCAWLERYALLTSLRVRVRGTDPQVSRQLEEIRAAAMSWGSDCGTAVDPVPEPAAGLEYLGTSQVAKLVGVGPRAVVKAIAEGRLPAQLVGNQWRVARVDAEHYKAARAA
jgi:excisionase family DNA binding protein